MTQYKVQDNDNTAMTMTTNQTKNHTGCRELNPGKAPRQPYSVDHTGGVSVPGPERGAYEDEV